MHDGVLWLVFSNAFACAVIGLTLNHASYLVEILRGGLDAVPAGMTEASAALGISPRQTFTWIRFPLAMRYALKAYQNEVLMFTKGTAIVGVITVVDLTAAANEVFERTYDPVTPMLLAAALYWMLVNVMRIGFDQLDRVLNRHLIADEKRQRDAGCRAATGVAGALDQVDHVTHGTGAMSGNAPHPAISISAPGQVVRRISGAEADRPARHARREDRGLRAVGFGQIDADPLHQPAGAA